VGSGLSDVALLSKDSYDNMLVSRHPRQEGQLQLTCARSATVRRMVSIGVVLASGQPTEHVERRMALPNCFLAC
jgi:hypothetical protein